MRHRQLLLASFAVLSLACVAACGDDGGGAAGGTSGDGDGDTSGTGDDCSSGGRDAGSGSSTAGNGGGDPTSSSGAGAGTPCNPDETCGAAGDFRVGGDVVFEGDAAVGVALQTVADVAGIASSGVDHLTSACRAIAEELGAPADQRAAVAGLAEKTQRMNRWCELAVTAVTTLRGASSMSIELEPPRCAMSALAKAECQGRCAGQPCDADAQPPTCEGGKLVVACRGSCEGESGSSVDCVGSCAGSCEGACTSQGGVECAGFCDGACDVSTDQNGNCNGTCQGTCEAVEPNVTCEGSCDGSCSASCEGSAEAAVLCGGSCSGESEPLRCEGGTLRGGCAADATCEAFCNADVAAKALCTPTTVQVRITGQIDANASGVLAAVLERALPAIIEVQSRFAILGAAVAPVRGVEAGDLGGVKGACVPVVVAAAASAADNVDAVTAAATTVIASLAGG
jgi:hypothetical protein